MAAVALDQYLMSVLKADMTGSSEVKLEAGNKDFDLFTIYLENHDTNIHHYRMDVSTIIYVVKGNVTIKSGEKSLLLRTGHVLLLTENSRYDVLDQSKGAIIVKMKFQPGFEYRRFFNDFAYKGTKEEEIISKIAHSLENEHVLWMKNNPLTRPSQIMRHIIDGYLNEELFTRALIGAELTVVLIVSIRNQRMVSPTSLDKTKFEGKSLDNYIDSHFDDISLAKTAKYFGFNPNYFSNMVKQKTGKSFVDHVDERRMQEAKVLLAQPDVSLKEIISRVGYSSKSFFYKKFNDYYHETPAAMRERLFRNSGINLK